MPILMFHAHLSLNHLLQHDCDCMVLIAMQKYMEELMKANPNIAPNDASTSGLTAHLKAEFSHTDFLQVFIYLKSFLDWEKTPKEGKAYCRGKICSKYILNDKAIIC